MHLLVLRFQVLETSMNSVEGITALEPGVQRSRTLWMACGYRPPPAVRTRGLGVDCPAAID